MGERPTSIWPLEKNVTEMKRISPRHLARTKKHGALEAKNARISQFWVSVQVSFLLRRSCTVHNSTSRFPPFCFRFQPRVWGIFGTATATIKIIKLIDRGKEKIIRCLSYCHFQKQDRKGLKRSVDESKAAKVVNIPHPKDLLEDPRLILHSNS